MHSTRINEHYMVHMNLDIDYELLALFAENVQYKPVGNGGGSANSNKDRFWDRVDTWQSSWIINPTGHMQDYSPVLTAVRAGIKELHDYLSDLFKAKIGASFLHQDPNTEVPMHRDSRTLCSVNILTIDHYSPITFEDIGDINYKCALINTRQRHMVKPHTKDRYLLKFSVQDRTYEECYEKLSN